MIQAVDASSTGDTAGCIVGAILLMLGLGIMAFMKSKP